MLGPAHKRISFVKLALNKKPTRSNKPQQFSSGSTLVLFVATGSRCYQQEVGRATSEVKARVQQGCSQR